jgi:hypothetical protein
MFDSVIGPAKTLIGVGVLISSEEPFACSEGVTISDSTACKFDVLVEKISKLSLFGVTDEWREFDVPLLKLSSRKKFVLELRNDLPKCL